MACMIKNQYLSKYILSIKPNQVNIIAIICFLYIFIEYSIIECFY